MPTRIHVGVAAAVLVLLALAGAWFLTRPGGSDQHEAESDQPVLPYLRLALSRDANTGTVDITGATLIETTVRPLTGMGGHYAVLDGDGGVLAASPFAFPTHAIEEYRDGGGAMVGAQEVELTRQSVIVFLPFDTDARTLRILDVGGQTAASLDAGAIDQIARSTGTERGLVASWLAAVETPVEAASLADLQAAFPHILFGTSSADLSSVHQDSVAGVVSIDFLDSEFPSVTDGLYEALSELASRSPTLIGSIGSITMVQYPDAGIFTPPTTCDGLPPAPVQRGASTVGNQITINIMDSVDGELEIVGPGVVRQHLSHEAVHAFHKLMDNAANVVEERLPPGVVTRVNDMRDNLGYMDGALSGSWGQMQASARIAYDGYGEYQGSNWPCAYPVEAGAVAAGFKRGYGSASVFEDVATYVEMFYDDSSPFAAHAVCQQFSGLTDEVPRPKLLAFAKLNFLRGLELIAEADYQACVQDADPASERGFMLTDVNHSDDLKAGSINLETNMALGEEGSRWAVLGSTSDGQALFQIFARPPYYSALGFHRLDNTLGWLTPYEGLAYRRQNGDAPRSFRRRNLITWQPTDYDGAIELATRTRISSGGFAVVVDNLPGSAKGYAFFVPFENYLGRQTSVQDLIWFQLED
mgnify:CR=1 FL=1|jgi:hypothetical protein